MARGARRPSATSGSRCPTGRSRPTSEVVDAGEQAVDLASIAARERVTRHDVKARIEEFSALAGLRADPQGDDLARPDGERRAAADPSPALRAAASIAPMARLAGAAGQTGQRRTRRLVMAGRSHNVAAQATTLGKRFATVADELMMVVRPARRARSPAIPCAASRARWAPAQDMLDLLDGDVTKLERAGATMGRGTSASSMVLTSVGQVYPRSLDFDVLSALVQLAGRAVEPGHHDPADGRHRAGHRGLRRRARSAPRRCRTR